MEGEPGWRAIVGERHGASGRWDDDAEAAGTHLNFDRGAGLVRFTVGVDDPRGRTLDNKLRAAHSPHVATAIETAEEEPRREIESAENPHRLHRDQIKEAVIDSCSRSDAGVVAPLPPPTRAGARAGEHADATTPAVTARRGPRELSR